MFALRDRIHFVGSVPLPTADTVFRQVAAEVGPFIRRIPDGETGERTGWIRFQQKMLMEHPAIELDLTQSPLPVIQSDGTVLRQIQLMRLKPDVDPEEVNFDTGYDRAAIASYEIFRRMRSAGEIPSGVRFQVALPTPMATGLMYISPVGRERYLRVYERALLRALRNIASSIRHADLSIQFDVCQEVLLFENYFSTREPNYQELVFRQFGRLGAVVPDDVELGFHLCYGSPGDQPLLHLQDAQVLVELMNGIADHVKHPVAFIHIPAPMAAKQSFFEPLRNWRKPAQTQLYLGLLQFDDDLGNRARIEAAHHVVEHFGVGAECGFGRTDPKRVPRILAGHRAAADLL